MSDIPPPVAPGSTELEALVGRAVSELVEPVQARLADLQRALAILAVRMPQTQPVDALAERVDVLAAKIDEGAGALAAQTDEARRAQTDELRQALAVAVSHAVAKIAETSRNDVALILERVSALEASPDRAAENRRLLAEDLRKAAAAAVDDAVARFEAAQAADTGRVLDRVAALEGPLAADAAARQDQTEGLRQTVAAVQHVLGQVDAARSADAIAMERSLAQIEAARASDAAKLERALARIESARAADTTRLHRQIADLAEPLGLDAAGRQAQVDEIRTAILATAEQAVAEAEVARAADATRISEQISALAEPLAREADARRAFADELLERVERSLSQAAAPTDDAGRLLEQVASLAEALRGEAESRDAQAEELRRAVGGTVEQAIAAAEAARAADAARLLGQVAALEASLSGEAAARWAQVEDLRETVAGALDQVIARIEAAPSTGAPAVLDEVRALAGQAAVDAQRREEQAVALIAAVDERLQTLHVAAGTDGDARAERVAARLEAVTAEHLQALLTRLEAASAASGQALLARLDDQGAAVAGELASVAPRVTAQVSEATSAAVAGQLERLVDRLLETTDALAQEGARLEALARSQSSATRVAEDRVVTLLTEVAERAERAVDRSRARIAEGQVALAARFEASTADLLRALGAATDRLEVTLAEGVAGLRTTDDGQDGRLDGALADLRASQAELRELVQDGAHKAELAAVDVRGLRDRLAPHLTALAEATTRRADADQAGFDAVLARLDKLLEGPPG